MKSANRIARSFWRRGLLAMLAAGAMMAGWVVAADPADSSAKNEAAKPVPSGLGTAILRLFGVTSEPAPVVTTAPLVAATPVVAAYTTHEFKTAIEIRSSDGAHGVQTFCVDHKGRLIAIVAPPRNFDASRNGVTSEVHVLDADGKPITDWQVDFHAQSINVDPEDAVYVAGNATVAKFTADGKLVKQVDLPHTKEMLKDTTALRERAEAQYDEQHGSNNSALAAYRKRIERLEAKDEEKRTKSEKRMLVQLRNSLRLLEEEGGEGSDGRDAAVDEIFNYMTSRLRIINSIAVSEQDVFIVCGESKGYGYALWRMDRDFENPKQVKSEMRGCCGQMDVQVQGNDILVAENCGHAFARYDRDGKQLGMWGNKDGGGASQLFGGCCNPMNVRAGANGEIYTAESEGIVKRFSSDGELQAVIGQRPLSGGCKNVAVAPAPDGKTVYLCDMPGSKVVVMVEKSAEPEQPDTEKAAPDKADEAREGKAKDQLKSLAN